MAKPYICFCGDKEKCRNMMKSCSAYVRSVYISKANVDRILISPSRHPFLVCMIFPAFVHSDETLYRKIYRYCIDSRCPVHVIGSRRNLQTIAKLVPDSLFQRSDSKLMLQTIRELSEYISSDPNAEFAAMKSRFRVVSVISSKASMMSLCEDKLSSSAVKPRIIFSSPRCTDKELGYIKKETLSGIITDEPLNDRSLTLTESKTSEQIPVAMLDRKETYGKKTKVIHLDSKNDSDAIADIITNYDKRMSKLFFIRNGKI